MQTLLKLQPFSSTVDKTNNIGFSLSNLPKGNELRIRFENGTFNQDCHILSTENGTSSKKYLRPILDSMYVDGVLQGEQETGFSPYSWTLDTTEMSAGKHLVTVNIATVDGQTGAASTWIEVAE